MHVLWFWCHCNYGLVHLNDFEWEFLRRIYFSVAKSNGFLNVSSLCITNKAMHWISGLFNVLYMIKCNKAEKSTGLQMDSFSLSPLLWTLRLPHLSACNLNFIKKGSWGILHSSSLRKSNAVIQVSGSGSMRRSFYTTDWQVVLVAQVSFSKQGSRVVKKGGREIIVQQESHWLFFWPD